LLGNSDWVQQVRRHDAIILKMIENGWQFDPGGAFNQNTDAINYNVTYYTPANVPATIKDSKGNLVNTPAGFIPFVNSVGISAKNGAPAFLNPPGTNGLNQDYKALEYLYIAKKIDKTKISGLFLTDQFGKYKLDSVKNVSGTDVGYVYGRRFNQPGVNTRFTTGLLINPVFGTDNQRSANGGFYYQGGNDKSGRKINCDAMILAIGTMPNLEIAKECGLECRRGVTVNERLQTSDPSIYAIGEIADFDGTLYGITAAAEQQAEVVAGYMNGDIASYYTGSLFMNIIRIHGFDLCSIGLPECLDDKDYEEIVFIDKAKRYYKKCIVHKDRLVGAILIGDKTEFLEFRDLIANKTELSEKRLQLLRSGNKADLVLGKLVCSCNNVGSENITKRIGEDCNTLKDLCNITDAGKGCGLCRPEVKRLLDEVLERMAFIKAV
jgi:bacterioferritin-associated ferredoxin